MNAQADEKFSAVPLDVSQPLWFTEGMEKDQLAQQIAAYRAQRKAAQDAMVLQLDAVQAARLSTERKVLTQVIAGLENLLAS